MIGQGMSGLTSHVWAMSFVVILLCFVLEFVILRILNIREFRFDTGTSADILGCRPPLGGSLDFERKKLA